MYPIISTDLARLNSVNGERAVYISAVRRHPEYAAWDEKILPYYTQIGANGIR